MKLSRAVDIADKPTEAMMTELVMAQQILEDALDQMSQSPRVMQRALRLIKSELLRRK